MSIFPTPSNAAMPSAGGPINFGDQKIKIVANFEEGADSPFESESVA
jgi:hypothetical protein